MHSNAKTPMLMKKTIIILLACMAISANAQLKVYHFEDMYKTIAGVQNDDIRVSTPQSGRRFLLLFDKLGTDTFVHFEIGNGKEAELALLDLYNYSIKLKEGEFIDVDDNRMIPLRVTKDATGLNFKFAYRDKVSHLTPREILTLHNALAQYIEDIRPTLDSYDRHFILGDPWPEEQ